jgi:nitrate/TMAO reductase-like tetraheme cytochrome c subunit
LDKQENVDIVVNYLVKSGVAPKYIQEIIPQDNFKQIISKIKDKNTPEYRFFHRLTISILVTNLIALTILFIII